MDAYATACAVLTGWAESDLNPKAKHPTDDTWGVFQQNPRWWENARNGTRAQCIDFLDRFGKISRSGTNTKPAADQKTDVIADCWRVQNWTVKGQPTPLTDLAAWAALPNTRNYSNHFATAMAMVKTGKVQ